MKRGRPFELGNRLGRGRPQGSRNKTTREALEILDQYREPLFKKCIARALEGDVRALALCIDRMLPSLREPGVRIRMPKLKKITDIDLALQRIADGIGSGNLTPGEGEKIHTILQHHRNNIQAEEMEARLAALEKQTQEQADTKGRRR
jgi:hypothetical protein